MIKKMPLALISLMLVSTMLMGCLNESDSDDEEETEYYPPIISILSPRNYETVSGMVEIEVRVVPERPGVVIAYYIDEILLETSQSTSFSWDTTETENRQHLLEVTALETGENVPAGIRPSKAAVKVNVYNPPEIPEEPNTPPTIEMFAPSGDAHGVYRGPIVVRGKTADEETRLDNIEMRIDEDEWFQVQVSRKRWHYTLDPGSFTGEVKIEVRAFDGNDYSEIASMVLECDNTAPDIAFLNQNDRDTISGIITLQADVEDDHDLTYISFSINDIELQNSTGNSCELDTKEFENGDYTLMIEAADILENYARKSISVTIHNNHPPEVTITSPKNGSTHRGNITVKGTVSDPEGEFSSLEYRLDNGEWDALSVRENWSFTLNTTGLEDGEHTLEVRAEDDKGATDTASLKFISDNTAPVVDITSPTVEYVRGMVDIEAEITENGSGLWSVEFRIKNETVQSGTDTSYEWDTTKEDDGPEYRIEVIATDNTGSNGSDEITVLVDNTPPEITGISPADGTFLSGTVNIDPPLRDTGSGIGRIIFTLDGNEVKNSTSRTYSWNTTFYEDGSHEVGIRVFDRAGNSGEGGYTYFVDNTAPSVEITSPEEGAHIQGEGSIRADVSDNIGGSGIHSVRFFFNALIQGTDYEAPYKFDFNSDDYTDGDYTVTVMVRDIAGNTAQDMVGIRLGEVIDPIISDPHTNHLSPYDVAGKERLIFEDYRAVPIVSSRVRNGGVMPSVNWDGAENPKDSLNINMPAETGYAGFSGNIALSYWSTPEKAIVVDNYQHAVMMTAYASIMDYPIIVYDSANPKVSDEALWKIETIYATQIITLGITPYNDKGVTVFTEDDIVPEAIGAAQFKGIMLDYITVVNPDDMPGISNTGYLSCFAGVFASHHNGLIVPCRASANEMNTKIHNAINALNESGMPAKHIAIVGDHKSLPMINEGGTPSDNSYADLDGNKYTIEISIGRIVAKELHDLSYYADRVVNYQDYLAIELGTPPMRMLDPLHWNNNAMIYMGWLAEFAEDSENHCREYLWALGRFNTQDDSDKAHAGLGTTAMMVDLSMTNYFIINADHGSPTGTVTWGSEHLPDMHPGITFGVSCSLGRIDNVNKNTSVTYTMMEKGMNVYLAPTRTAFGSFVQTYPYQPIAAPGLCYLYIRFMIDNDYDSGVAYMHAKNDLINNGYGGGVDRTTTWQYQHFGDPAFNPYEPCHEGSPF